LGGNDKIFGGFGVDVIDAGLGTDFVDGGAGNDQIAGADGDDVLLGGVGTDTINGGDGDDLIEGDEDSDSLIGGAGDDKLYGGAGADQLTGADGIDSLFGDAGVDQETNSGSGADVCQEVETIASCSNLVSPAAIPPAVFTASGASGLAGVTVTVETNGGAVAANLQLSPVSLNADYQSLSAGPAVDIELQAPIASLKSAVITLPVNSSLPLDKVGVFTREGSGKPWTEVTDGVTPSATGHGYTVTTSHFSNWATFVKWSVVNATANQFPIFDPRVMSCVPRSQAEQVGVALIGDSSGSMATYGPENPAADAIAGVVSEIPTSNLRGYGFSATQDVDLSEDAMDLDAFGASELVPSATRAIDALVADSKVRLRLVVISGDGSTDDSVADLAALRQKAVTAKAAISYVSFGPVDPEVSALVAATGGTVYSTTEATSEVAGKAFVDRYFDTGSDLDQDTLSDCEEQKGVLAYDYVQQLVTQNYTQPSSLLGPPAVFGNDSDFDRVRDNVELLDASTDPFLVKLSYGLAHQVRWKLSDPILPDTDFDKHSDLEEISYGADALVFAKGWEYLVFASNSELATGFGGLYTDAKVTAWLQKAGFWSADLASLTPSARFSYAVFQSNMYLDNVAHEFDQRGWFWDEFVNVLDNFVTIGTIPETHFIRDVWEDKNAPRRLDYLRSNPAEFDRMFSQVVKVQKLLNLESLVVTTGDQLLVSVILSGFAGKILSAAKFGKAQALLESAAFKRVGLVTTLGSVYCNFGGSCSPEMKALLDTAAAGFGIGMSAANYGKLTPVSQFVKTRFVSSGSNTLVEINPFTRDAAGLANFERIDRGLPPLADNGQPIVSLTENGITKELPTHAEGLGLADDANVSADFVGDAVTAGKSRWQVAAKAGVEQCFLRGPNSFSGDTQVLMADSTKRRIDQIRKGDLVSSLDPQTGERGPRAVSATWVHDDVLADFKTSAGRITTTENHKVWNATDREWQDFQNIDLGDVLISADGKIVTANGFDLNSWHQGQAYNLSVEDLHTYFVVIGDKTILVHNVDCRTVFESARYFEDEATEYLKLQNAVVSASLDVETQISIRVSGVTPAGPYTNKLIRLDNVVHKRGDVLLDLEVFDAKYTRTRDLSTGSILDTLTENQQKVFPAWSGVTGYSITSIRGVGKGALEADLLGDLSARSFKLQIVVRDPITRVASLRPL
jgi:Pretoxin HINT domain/RTX calcium-binding nonapeptide repeat (4 copies)